MKRLATLVLACVTLGGCAAPGDDPATAPAPSETDPRELGDMGDQPLPEADDAEAAPESETLSRLREAVEQDPSDAQAHRSLGVGLRRSGQIDEAFEHLEQAARLAPDDPGILLSLGTAYSGEQRVEDAEALYLRLLEVAPDHAMAMNNLGNLALRRGDQDAAIDWYRRATEADPQYLMARHRLAEQLRFNGRYDEAYPEYERILKMQPKDAREGGAQVESLYAMGAISLARADYELAERQLSRVVQSAPNHRSAHWSRAQALIQLGRQDEAQRELQMHLRIRHSMGQGF